MRKIGIMIGSDSDLLQCLDGLRFLKEMEAQGMAKVHAVITNSIHRNTKKVLMNLETDTREKEIEPLDRVDIWIIGAGCANHLTGTVDAYLRYQMQNSRVPVIGVAFENKDPEKTLAAILSILHVPGTQVVFDRNRHVGANGFFNACQDAVYKGFPRLKTPTPKEDKTRTLAEAITAAENIIN